MSCTKQKVPSPILGQRNFAYARNHFPARSPILGGRDSSEDELDDASVTDATTTHYGMSRGKATGRSNRWQPPTASRKPLIAMAKPGPERQLSPSPEYTPASPSFATAGLTNPRSPVFAARNPNFNPSSSGRSNALYAHYQAQHQSQTSGPSSLPDYQSPGMNYQEHFTSYRAIPENSFAMLPSLMSDLSRNLGSMNDSNCPWKHSKVSRRKRPSEEDDDFFVPLSKRRQYSFGFNNETTAMAADQTPQNSGNRVYVGSNYGTTPAGGDVEMNNYRAPESSNIYAGMVYQAAPSTPRGRAADDYNRPQATFPCDIEYTTTEMAYGPNYSGKPGLVIQQKPISTVARGTSSFDSAVATKPNLPQILPRLPPLGTVFGGLSSIQSPRASPPSWNNDYSTQPQENVNHVNILNPSPQRSIRAEVFHTLEAHGDSVDSDTVDPLILHSYAPSPALSEGSPRDAENQNSNENPPVESLQEENTINRHDTDSVTLAEDTLRQSIEVPDNTDTESVISHHSRNNHDNDNGSVISHHSRNNNVDDNNNQLLILQEEVTDLGVELYGVQRELSNHRENFEALYTRNTEYSTELPTISGDVERLQRRIQAQSDETTQLRNELNTLRAEASEQRSRFHRFMNLVVEVADQSRVHGEQINQLTQREARAQIEIANDAPANKVDELAALTREVIRLQNRVLTLQNDALEKHLGELRAISGL
ncbi:hypothetical protein EAF00_001806 [Botryotinia globosa]|nr:hypothetical protein EAF00_001806 [Botryotinia globosa]